MRDMSAAVAVLQKEIETLAGRGPFSLENRRLDIAHAEERLEQARADLATNERRLAELKAAVEALGGAA